MAEGGTYVCRWEKKRRQYVLWLEEQDDLKSEDPDFGAAADELASLIGLWNGDGEAVLEFDPPRPVAGEASLSARLVSVGYNASARVLNRSPALFEGGLCGHCQFGIGARTDVPLEIGDVPKGDVLGLERLLPHGLLLSEPFLGLLNEEERARLVLQPVVSSSKQPLMELKGESVTATVGVQAAEYPSAFLQSWSCRECSRTVFITDSERFAGTEVFLARSALPDQIPSVFAFDDGFRMCLAMTQIRWRELLGRKPGTHGVSTISIGVIPDALVELRPEVPQPDEFDWVL